MMGWSCKIANHKETVVVLNTEPWITQYITNMKFMITFYIINIPLNRYTNLNMYCLCYNI